MSGSCQAQPGPAQPPRRLTRPSVLTVERTPTLDKTCVIVERIAGMPAATEEGGLVCGAESSKGVVPVTSRPMLDESQIRYSACCRLLGILSLHPMTRNGAEWITILSSRTNAINERLFSRARSTARLLAAPTEDSMGNPSLPAFWTNSNV